MFFSIYITYKISYVKGKNENIYKKENNYNFWVVFLCISFFLFLALGLLLSKFLFSPVKSFSISPSNTLARNPIVDKNNYSQGHILIVPLGGSGDFGLYNKKGYFEKIWSTQIPTFYGEMMDNNKVLLVHQKSSFSDPSYLPGDTGLIAVYNDKGQLETSFEDDALHHDIAIKNSSRIFAFSRYIKKIKHKQKNIKIVDNSIIEIDLDKQKIVNTIKLFDYFPFSDKLIQNRKTEINYNNSFNIFHPNGIDYISENPINGK